MRCKHDWIIITADNLKCFIEDNQFHIDGSVGYDIICSKCGKYRRRLSRKIGKIYANTLMLQSYNNEVIKDYGDEATIKVKKIKGE